VSRRVERIASIVQSVLAQAIRERLSDPRIEPLTSITRVEISPDLSVAHVHVSVMAAAPQKKLTLIALQHAGGRLRTALADHLSMRQVPWLHFHLDESLQKSFKTIQILDDLMAERAARAAEQPSASDAAMPAAEDR